MCMCMHVGAEPYSWWRSTCSWCAPSSTRSAVPTTPPSAPRGSSAWAVRRSRWVTDSNPPIRTSSLTLAISSPGLPHEPDAEINPQRQRNASSPLRPTPPQVDVMLVLSGFLLGRRQRMLCTAAKGTAQNEAMTLFTPLVEVAGSVWSYAMHRALRLWPMLIMCLALQVGPYVHRRPHSPTPSSVHLTPLPAVTDAARRRSYVVRRRLVPQRSASAGLRHAHRPEPRLHLSDRHVGRGA
jgi:hypothetical protein